MGFKSIQANIILLRMDVLNIILSNQCVIIDVFYDIKTLASLILNHDTLQSKIWTSYY